MAFTFSGNNWTLTATSAATLESIQESGTFTLDSTANPKTIDLYTTSFPTAPELVGTTSLGIYLLSGTNLTVAIAGNPGDARPTAFTEGNPVFIKQ
jgi:uncharacterized protein (TIGR03067 family)